VESRSEALTISVPEAGKRLGLSRNSAYQAAQRGELPVLRIGHRLLVSIFALDEMLGLRRSLPGEEVAATRPRTDRAERR
jgi:excisionase family DNA binding protein